MSIRSLSFVAAIVTLVLFASALPKPATAQAPKVYLAPQEFEIMAQKLDFKHNEMTYCGIANDVYFVFEPATKYSPEYVSFHYKDHETVAHDEALLRNITVVIDDTVAAPKARIVGTERGDDVWEIVVTTAMKQSYSGCLGKIKTR